MIAQTYGNPRAEVITVYYTGTSDLYEGSPVCYEFDTATNWYGVDTYDNSESTTTTDGYQNEGKYMMVKDPDADNIHAFAGVVHADSAGTTNPGLIKIYVPNGAVVPVRADQDCTEGLTVLAVHTGELTLTAPHETAGRPVAVAWETYTRGASTAGLILAKLDPNMFLYQKGDAASLSVDDEDTGNMVINRIDVTSAQTSGNFTALSVKGAMTGTGAATGTGLALYAEATITGVVSGETAGSSFWLNITGGTQTGAELYAAEVGLYESGANLAAIERISPLCVRSQLDGTNPPSDGHYMMTFICDGTGDHPDGWFATNEVEDIAMTEETGSMTNAIAFKVGPPGSETTYYLMVSNSVS